MKRSSIYIGIAGALNILLAVFHAGFHFLFSWNSALQCLSEINSNIIQMLNYCFVIYLAGTGFVQIKYRRILIQSEPGKSILWLIGFVYLARFFMEFIFPGGSVIFGLFILLLVILQWIPLWFTIQKTDRTLHESTA